MRKGFLSNFHNNCKASTSGVRQSQRWLVPLRTWVIWRNFENVVTSVQLNKTSLHAPRCPM